MQNLLRWLLLLSLLVSTAQAQARLGEVRAVVDKNTVPVRVSGNTPELNALALQAFGAHGRYRVVASGHVYDIRFSAVAANQVRVDVTEGASTGSVLSQIVPGTTARVALLKAADLAVEKTNGLGLRGFFTARLTFVGDSGGRKEVYMSDLFLGELKQLTNDRSQVMTPRWAPDGSNVVFTSYLKSGSPDIYRYDLRSFVRTTLVSLRGTNMGARYSPNGQRLAMILSGEGTSQVYVANPQGRGITRLTRTEEVKASPVWSPDGGRIVFAMGQPSPQLFVMGATGGTPQRLMTGFSYAAEPDWSRADPRKIACTVRVGSQYQIAVYDFAAGRAAVVSKASFDAIEPSWLADGRHLVCTLRASNGATMLYILDTESGQSVPLSAALTRDLRVNALQASVWTP